MLNSLEVNHLIRVANLESQSRKEKVRVLFIPLEAEYLCEHNRRTL